MFLFHDYSTSKDAFSTDGNGVWSVTDTIDWLGIYVSKYEQEEAKNAIIKILFLFDATNYS